MSTHRHLIILAGSMLCAATLHAGSAATDKTGAAPEKAEAPASAAEPTPEPYQLKKRSSFSRPPENTRPPFWPIGWVHREGVSSAVASAAAPKSTLDEKSFRLTSVLLGSGATASLAVINGRAYGEGEFLKTPRGTPAAAAPVPGAPAAPAVARIRVQRITDGSVVLQRAEQTVTISMQRQELAQKRIEETLLDDDR